MLKRIIIFLILNFAALGIGGWLMGEGPASEWYNHLNQAPWTPPGWVFGAAWSFIMVCFAVFMALAWNEVKNRKLLLQLYAIQWILNVSWNPVFFFYHEILGGFVIIVALTILVLFFQAKYFREMKFKTLLIDPYIIWLIIATSLNGYIYFNN